MFLELNSRHKLKRSQSAKRLLRTDENDHVVIHEIRGFMADDLVGKFEFDAVAAAP